MISSDLRTRQQKLEKEQQERAAAARRKAEKERIAAERVRSKKLQYEQEQREKRLAQAKVEEEAHHRKAAELERNNGVVFSDTFTAVPGSEQLAKEKGIKRAADKVLLPSSVGNQLLEQDAPKNGAMLFEIQLPSGKHTHAGLLEFTAPEGTVVIPTKVRRCLWGLDSHKEDCFGDVKVTYSKLREGTFCRLQPRTSGFHQAVGDDVKSVLELAMKSYCTLTEGDWLDLEVGGVMWQLLVRELQPDPQVSIMDTDLEVQLEPSIETQERLMAEEEAARQRLQQLATIREQEQAAQVAAEAQRQRLAAEEEAAAQLLEEQRQQKTEVLARQMQEREASLPSQPEAGPQTVECMIRLPDGSRCSRRFRNDDKVRLLFDFVDTKSWQFVAFGGYQLIAQFPRRSLSLNDVDKALSEAGLSGQEMLLLQPLEAQQ